MPSTKTSPTTLTEARAALDALTAERDTLPGAIAAAQRAGDPVAHLWALTRADDIETDLTAARRVVLPLELKQAWTDAEQLHAAEVQRHTEHADAEEALNILRAVSTIHWTPTQRAKHQVALAAARDAATAATRRLDDARDATGPALRRVDLIEAELTALGEELPPPGAGIRAARRSLAGTVTVACRMFGPLAAHVAAEADSVATFGEPKATFLVGTVPARWVAQRIGEHAFISDEVRVREVAEHATARAAARDREFDEWAQRVTEQPRSLMHLARDPHPV